MHVCMVCVCVCVYAQIVSFESPSHMYFDIEFSRAANPGMDGPQLVSRLVELVKRLFRCVCMCARACVCVPVPSSIPHHFKPAHSSLPSAGSCMYQRVCVCV